MHLLFAKEFAQKYIGKIDISVFCIFCFIFFNYNGSLPNRSICLIDTVLLIPILAYFTTFFCNMAYVIKCHKTPFYDNLWHMPCRIKCHKICQYGYQKNRLDQTNWSIGFKILFQEQNKTKNGKHWNNDIPFVFLSKILCKLKIAFLQP